LVLAASSVHCSSSGTCNLDIAVPDTNVTVVGDDGKPVCDAYITDHGFPYCTWAGCICVHKNLQTEDSTLTLAPLITVSRRGYEPQTLTATLPGNPDCATAHQARQLELTIKATAVAGGCIARDTLVCADHRTCYDGATAPGCIASSDSSTDPGASYVCCKLGGFG
jgi:hypothetical protein